MKILEELKAQADSAGEQYPKSLSLRAAAEIKELRETLGIALAALEQTDILAKSLRKHGVKDMPKEPRGELNITEPTVWRAIKMAQDTLECGF